MPERSNQKNRPMHNRSDREDRSKRSEAAKKGWETRRKNAAKRS